MTASSRPLISAPDSIGEGLVLIFDTVRKIYESLPKVDVVALCVWIDSGFSLFQRERLPTLKQVIDEAERVILSRASALHGGNITYMAESLGASRRTIREHMKRVGVYGEPEDAWEQPESPASDPPHEVERQSEPAERGDEEPTSDGVPVELPDDDEYGETHPYPAGERDE